MLSWPTFHGSIFKDTKLTLSYNTPYSNLFNRMMWLLIYVIQCNTNSYDYKSYDIIFYHMTLNHIKWYCIASYHRIFFYNILSDTILYDNIALHMIQYQNTKWYDTPHMLQLNDT